jgi:Skp family chaperone for outer membrane proteins
MHVKSGFLIFAIVLSNLIGVGIGMLLNGKSKTAVVNLPALWDEFEMRKELQGELEQMISTHSKRLDEIRMELAGQMSDAGGGRVTDEGKYRKLMEGARNEESEITYLTEVEALERESAIKKRMSEYLKEYCRSSDVSIMISTSDVDPVIYCAESIDRTQAAIEYLNTKYLGK